MYARRARTFAVGACSARSAGQRLRPQDVALAAAFGLTELEVRRRIRVAVFSTGNELVIARRAARGARNCSTPIASC